METTKIYSGEGEAKKKGISETKIVEFDVYRYKGDSE